MNNKKCLDACCGSKMFWFNKNNPLTVYQDERVLDTTLCDGRQLIVNPDVICDFTDMHWDDGEFKIVILDPPHLKKVGDTSWMGIKYGKLPKDFKPYIRSMFRECFRVLEDDGVLVFKWNESQILVSEILKQSPYNPMIGHKSGKQQKTHWIMFMKNELMKKDGVHENEQ